MQGLALVDYDNVGGYRNRTKSDFELHAADLMDRLVSAFNAVFPDLDDLDVRLYGGWMDESGRPSPAALYLYTVLPALRRRHRGLATRVALATAMLEFPHVHLRGTMRTRGTQRRQKMVDGMLGCDAVFAAVHSLGRVGIVTDDDDLIPATLAAHKAARGHAVWIRSRPFGDGLNDDGLRRRGV